VHSIYFLSVLAHHPDIVGGSPAQGVFMRFIGKLHHFEGRSGGDYFITQAGITEIFVIGVVDAGM